MRDEWKRRCDFEKARGSLWPITMIRISDASSIHHFIIDFSALCPHQLRTNQTFVFWHWQSLFISLHSHAFESEAVGRNGCTRYDTFSIVPIVATMLTFDVASQADNSSLTLPRSSIRLHILLLIKARNGDRTIARHGRSATQRHGQGAERSPTT